MEESYQIPEISGHELPGGSDENIDFLAHEIEKQRKEIEGLKEFITKSLRPFMCVHCGTMLRRQKRTQTAAGWTDPPHITDGTEIMGAAVCWPCAIKEIRKQHADNRAELIVFLAKEYATRASIRQDLERVIISFSISAKLIDEVKRECVKYLP